MYSHVRARRSQLRVALSLTLCTALLVVANFSFLVSGKAQGRNQSSSRSGWSRPDKPEGLLPDLRDVQDESQIEREAPPLIPSTVRSPKNPLQPWDGRRVGDPETRIRSDQFQGQPR